uniref:Centrosomal protein of 68 kDa n=1 Tax=Leptobrachium leishanense TaxID=445787 RepID=A0A8C5MGK2_9ANUR
MDSPGEKDEFAPLASGYLTKRTASQLSLSMRSSISGMTDGNDDLEDDQEGQSSFVNSSWFSQGVPSCQIHHNSYLGNHKSMYPSFSKSNASEPAARKSRVQEEYWAYAIPDTLPPSPDRMSPHWNPDKEYQDLLDYTYPLNPKYSISKERDESDSDPFFNDSGIEVDSWNISCDNKLNSTGLSHEHDPKRDRYVRTHRGNSPYAFSTPMSKTPLYQRIHDPSEFCNEMPFDKPTWCPGKMNLHSESKNNFCLPTSTAFNKSGLFNANSVCKENLHPSSSIANTKVPRLDKDTENDEEYLSLPSRLKEMESLATHLNNLTLSSGKTRDYGYGQGDGGTQQWQLFDKAESREAWKDGGCEHGGCRCQDSMDHLNDFSSLRDMLSGSITPQTLDSCEFAPMHKVQDAKTLVQSIQKFCRNLDQLIKWLYGIAEITDNWITPKPDVESIQTSLSLYLRFKKDVAGHQTLADNVIKDGELLLKYMSVNSSALKETLSLISKQSGDLDRHAECLYTSVLDAMDTITDDGSRRKSNLS